MTAKPALAKAKSRAKLKAKPKAKSAGKAKPSGAERRLIELGIKLPEVPMPVANYVPFARAGNLVFLSGQVPRRADGSFYTGKVGTDVTIQDAYEHARLVGLQLLAVARQAAGSLDNVKRVVKLLGMVNGGPGFTDHPKVINGCSDLMVEVLGEAGKHARSAVGVGGLPADVTVEVEAIIELA
ncbi:MAG TPA: RidA family protein [Chloroflexota bacterium]|nr:RidA family protein [Chloroflexota bacterium]